MLYSLFPYREGKFRPVDFDPYRFMELSRTCDKPAGNTEAKLNIYCPASVEDRQVYNRLSVSGIS